jgi:5'-nucleotidase
VKRAATLVLFLLAAACATVQPPAEPVHVVLVGTNDLHGWFAGHPDKVPYGGLPVFASYISALRAANPGRVVLVDAGDLFQGTLESNLFEGEPVTRGYNALGYTASAVGNHEFDYGPVGPHVVAVDPGEDPLGALKKNAANAKFSFLAANITEKATGRPPSWLKPSMLVDVGGAKVGIIGLSTPDTPNTTIGSNVESLNFGNPVEATVREARALRAAGADAVVVIAHMGGHCADTSNPQDASSCERDQEAMRYLAAVPPGTVDAYVGGHTHSDIRHFINAVPASEAGAYSREFGTIDLYVDTQKHAVVADRTTIRPLTMICASVFAGTQTCDAKKAPAGAALVPATFEGHPIAPVAEVAAVLDPYLKQVAAKRSEPTGITTTAPVTRKYRAESALGDLLADAFRDWAHADVAMLNSGGIRANLRAGNLVYSDIFGVMPFDNVPAIVTMTGAQLTELIRLMTIPERGIPQISGLHYTFDEAGPRDNRLVAVTLPNGRPLDPNASYRVALPDFLVTGGEGLGPLMATIPADQKKIDQTITLRDLLINVLKKRSMPIQPSTDGRITVLNPPPPSEER